MKSLHAFLNLLHLTIFSKEIAASYGARMRGSVFRIVFRTFLREFESVETTPGFAQLLGEKLDFQNDVGK